ncbi:MAG: hypothetical protein ACFB9M_06445 [Myxococcota bacterium]
MMVEALKHHTGRWAKRWPYVLVAFLYFATSPYYTGLNNPNEMVRIYATRAYAESGSFIIDPVVQDWGPVDDQGRRDGAAYSAKAPWQSLVGIPAHVAGLAGMRWANVPATKRNVTFVLRWLSASLPSVLFAWALMAWCRRRSVELGCPQRIGNAVGLSLTLGTMLYPYALLYCGHGWAAVAVGSAALALLGLFRRSADQASWKLCAVALGVFGAVAPFAEYPAALAAGPLLAAAAAVSPRRLELLAWVGLGGLVPFGTGLWAHKEMWGSPFLTGYSFLDNPSYKEVHDHGFFGVQLPRADAAFGALFSAETGLFFYSPILLLGMAMVARSAFPRPNTGGGDRHRAVALASLTGVVLLFLFISSHSGWRGGWTLGPRYIIPVAPLLGLWVVEAMAFPKLWPAAAALGAVSIVATGVPASFYPHLSDAFTNPWGTFVIPTLELGLAPYGLGVALGFERHLANAVHLLPLAVAAGYVLLRGGAERPSALQKAWPTLAVIVFVGLVLVIPERDSAAADHERRRLWALWEPVPGGSPGADLRTHSAHVAGTLIRARRAATVDVDGARACRFDRGRCIYGAEAWQRLEVITARVGGERERVLSLHPISHREVEASFPIPNGSSRLRFRHSLTDDGAMSHNRSPVDGRILVDGEMKARFQSGNFQGWQSLEVGWTEGSTLSIAVRTDFAGSRAFVINGQFLSGP